MEDLVQVVEEHPEIMTYPRPRNEMEALVQAVESHPEVMNIPHQQKKKIMFNTDVKNSWEMVAKELNARRIFKSTLSGDDAKRKWCDLKYRTKKKAKALEKSKSENGGDESNIDFNAFLTPAEERVWDLMRPKDQNGAPTTSQNSSVSSSHINAPTTSQNSSVSSTHINASTSSLGSVLPPGHIIVNAQSSSFNSSLQSGHFIVHAPSSTTLPSGHILIQASTPVLPISTSIIADQSPNSSAQTPILTADRNLPASDLFLTDVSTVQTPASIKQEMFEIGEVETEPPLDDNMDITSNTTIERVLGKNNHLRNIRRCKELIKKGKKRIRKTEFDVLADIEERKMALLEEQIKIKRDHLKFQEKKTLIMEQQLAISQEQLTVSKEQLAISKQILQFKINKGS